MEMLTSGAEKVTDRQLAEAEEGLVRLLHKKRFPREWIERHVPEVMAQARTDFAVRLAAGKDDEAVNLLVVIGYRRALKVLNAQKNGPPTTSIETIFHLVDESTPTPEEEAIGHDRQEQVTRAMSHLPERERKLLSLVYEEGLSIRAAGRRLGWGKSAVNRHHRAALDRMEAFLDRSLLSPEIAIPAFIATGHTSAPRAVRVWIEGAAETVREAVEIGGNRASPLAEAGNAAAMSGAGKAAAGVCGAAVVACLAGAAGGVVGPGIGVLDAKEAPRSGAAHQVHGPKGVETPREMTASPTGDAEPAGPGESREGQRESVSRRQPSSPAPRSASEPRSRPATADPPVTTAKGSVNEFGVESGELDEPSGTTGAVENTPLSPRTSEPPAPARPKTSSAGEGTSSSSSGSPSGAQTSGEFGM